ncbi:MAG: hypothetical protein JXQ75_07595 [Phycisphaerae bacterium]|nr:hypothetical protein [Phycisphaerae bacterium]
MMSPFQICSTATGHGRHTVSFVGTTIRQGDGRERNHTNRTPQSPQYLALARLL